MRICASGLASTIAVAIDQTFRLAFSISGPMEPVVSSTKANSTTGLARTDVVAASLDQARLYQANGSIKKARAAALAWFISMISPSVGRISDWEMILCHRGCRGPELMRGHRLICGGFRMRFV